MAVSSTVTGTTNKEIEFKYSANISAYDYRTRIASVIPKSASMSTVDGKDDFYGSETNPRSFFRHRTGFGMNQLTYKEKVSKDNSFIRIEHNIDLNNTTPTAVTSFLSSLGYVYNTSLTKESWISTTDKYVVAYYICYRSPIGNRDYTFEVGRFIEIEVREDYPWKNTQEAYRELCALERKFKCLGIGPSKRIKKSLWELYKK